MRIVMSGMASRHKLPLDRLDDLQLAVETLLAEEPSDGGDLGLRLWTSSDRLHVRLEGLANQAVKSLLMVSSPHRPQSGFLLDVRLLLASLVDAYAVVEEDAGSYAVEMEKRAS
jgi:hypothetical protein